MFKRQNMNKIIKYIVYLSLIVIIGFGFYKKVYIPKHTFKTIHAKKGDIEIKVEGIGNVNAKNIYKVSSLYGGKVLDFALEKGEKIEEGTLVTHIDSVDLQERIASQKALIQKTIEDIKGLEVDKKTAEVDYRYQMDLFKKNQKLYKLKSISYLTFRKYQTSKDMAKLKIKSINSHIASLKKQISQIKEDIKGLQKKLFFYTITSPVTGYITKKYITNHQILLPGQPIVDIVNPKDVWVAAFIDTRISGQVKVGDEATIKLRSSDKIFKAKVVDIDPLNNPITYEREIDIAFDNLPIPFYLEEQAKISIKVKKLKNIIKIPVKTLTFYNGKNGVWILKNQKVEFKSVKILAYEDKTVAIKGITLDDTIVIPDPKKKTLKNGMKIYHD
jgi:RND family efflux transporter MFP subunit